MTSLVGQAQRRTGWERWCAWRDRTVASRRFQRLAASLPGLRWIARRRAAGLFDLVAGFVYSQVLLACVRVNLFELLADGPQTAQALAPRIGMNEAATERLLAAAVSLRLLEHRRGGRVGLGPLGAPLVGNDAITAMIEHHATLYADLRDPVALLRGESGPRAMADYWPYAEGGAIGADASDAGPAKAPMSPERAAAYSALMSASQPMVAEQVLQAVDLRRFRCLLDVGGGEGTFVAAVADHAPALRLQVFDLPPVAALARQRLAQRGLAGRTEVHAGSFLDDPLPRGADAISLVRVLFDHSDAHALRILAAVRAALPPGGTLIVAEPMAGTPGAEAMGDAYFGFYLLAMGRGRARSAADHRRLLEAAGFEQIEQRPTPMPLQAQVITARAPRSDRPDRNPAE